MLYLLLVSAILLAAACARAALDVDDPAEPWLKARVGVTDRVPVPFEPLRVEGDAVSCWGRRHRMAFPFPARISSQGEELLVGGYLHRDGRALIAISNPADDKVAARIDTRPLAPKLGGPFTARDAATGATIRPLGRDLVLAAPANSFRLLLLERTPGQ